MSGKGDVQSLVGMRHEEVTSGHFCWHLKGPIKGHITTQGNKPGQRQEVLWRMFWI